MDEQDCNRKLQQYFQLVGDLRKLLGEVNTALNQPADVDMLDAAITALNTNYSAQKPALIQLQKDLQACAAAAAAAALKPGSTGRNELDIPECKKESTGKAGEVSKPGMQQEGFDTQPGPLHLRLRFKCHGEMIPTNQQNHGSLEAALTNMNFWVDFRCSGRRWWKITGKSLELPLDNNGEFTVLFEGVPQDAGKARNLSGLFTLVPVDRAYVPHLEIEFTLFDFNLLGTYNFDSGEGGGPQIIHMSVEIKRQGDNITSFNFNNTSNPEWKEEQFVCARSIPQNQAK